MSMIMNATHKEKSVCAQGNWFTFKPKQIKNIGSENLAVFFSSNLAYEGFVKVSDQFEDPEYKASPEGKQELAEAEAKGVQQRVRFLQYIIDNDLNSLKSDMQKSNDNSDPRLQMSPQMVDHMKELSDYKKKLSEAKKEQVSQIEELEKLIG